MVADKAEISSESIESFQDAIIEFYADTARSLPWRETTDPYRILVSELMLQQTQVPRVIPKYEAFIKRFPTPQDLVDAPLADVLTLWQGLGYNRRAKYLKNAAEIFLKHPKPDHDALLSQKGIGEYTAAAVCAFAYNDDVAAIDVNIRRVFTRYFGPVDDAFIASCVPSGRSRDWHNALMDFGSMVCTKRSPSCEDCPLAQGCHALQHDTFGSEPSASQPRFKGSVRWHRGALLRGALDGKTVDQVFDALDESHRDKKRFDEALQGLVREGMLKRNGEALVPGGT